MTNQDQLNWENETDDNGNTRWVAPSCWHDECSAFEWRLQQELHDDAIRWVEAHDAELMDGAAEIFDTLEEAKAATQKKHEDHCASARAEAASSG